jgi:hypothetical protein
MKQTLVWTLVIVLAVCAAFWFGRRFERFKAGHFYEIRSEKTVPFGDKELHIQYVTESIGTPFLDPGTSVLTIREVGSVPITIYKAKRGFQESSPYVSDASIKDNAISWDDGLYQYELKIESSPHSDDASKDRARLDKP